MRKDIYLESEIEGGILLKRNLKGKIQWYWRAHAEYITEALYGRRLTESSAAWIYWRELHDSNFDVVGWLIRCEGAILDEYDRQAQIDLEW